jgi:hypothetical protein
MRHYSYLLVNRATLSGVKGQLDVYGETNIMHSIAAHVLPPIPGEGPDMLLRRFDTIYVLKRLVEVEISCYGCQHDKAGQLNHMGAGGCLEVEKSGTDDFYP